MSSSNSNEKIGGFWALSVTENFLDPENWTLDIRPANEVAKRNVLGMLGIDGECCDIVPIFFGDYNECSKRLFALKSEMIKFENDTHIDAPSIRERFARVMEADGNAEAL